MNSTPTPPLAPFSGRVAAPGHQGAYEDLEVALELGQLTLDEYAVMVGHTPEGGTVTIAGYHWLATHDGRGLAERHIRQTGVVTVCPSWCVESHPRRQLTASEVQHTAYEAVGDWGYVGVFAIAGPDQDEAPLLLAHVAYETDHTPESLRDAARALTVAADVYERITG